MAELEMRWVKARKKVEKRRPLGDVLVQGTDGQGNARLGFSKKGEPVLEAVLPLEFEQQQ